MKRIKITKLGIKISMIVEAVLIIVGIVVYFLEYYVYAYSCLEIGIVSLAVNDIYLQAHKSK